MYFHHLFNKAQAKKTSDPVIPEVGGHRIGNQNKIPSPHKEHDERTEADESLVDEDSSFSLSSASSRDYGEHDVQCVTSANSKESAKIQHAGEKSSLEASISNQKGKGKRTKAGHLKRVTFSFEEEFSPQNDHAPSCIMFEDEIKQLWYSTDELKDLKRFLVHIELRRWLKKATAWWPILSFFYEQSHHCQASSLGPSSTELSKPDKFSNTSLSTMKHHLAELYTARPEAEPSSSIVGLERLLLNWLYDDDTGASEERRHILQMIKQNEGTKNVADSTIIAFQSQQASRPFVWFARELALAQAKAIQQEAEAKTKELVETFETVLVDGGDMSTIVTHELRC